MWATKEVVRIYVIHFHTCVLLIAFLILDGHPARHWSCASPGKYTIGLGGHGTGRVPDERQSPRWDGLNLIFCSLHWCRKHHIWYWSMHVCLKGTGWLKHEDVQLANRCLITLIFFLQICSRASCHQLDDNGRRDPKVEQCRCNEIWRARTLKRKHFTSSVIDPRRRWNHDIIVASTHDTPMSNSSLIGKL